MKRYLLFYLSPIIMIFVMMIVGGIFIGVIGASGGFDGAEPSPELAGMVGVATFGIIMVIYLILPLIWLIFYAKFYRVAVGSLTLEKLEFSFAAKTKDWLLLVIGDFGLWMLAAVVTLVPLGLGAAAFGLFEGFQLPDPGEENGPFQTVVTFGILALFFIPFALVGPFMRYRHWAFFIRHMEAYGEIDIAALTQSQTKVNKHGEGLLDALDVGAF